MTPVGNNGHVFPARVSDKQRGECTALQARVLHFADGADVRRCRRLWAASGATLADRRAPLLEKVVAVVGVLRRSRQGHESSLAG